MAKITTGAQGSSPHFWEILRPRWTIHDHHILKRAAALKLKNSIQRSRAAARQNGTSIKCQNLNQFGSPPSYQLGVALQTATVVVLSGIGTTSVGSIRRTVVSPAGCIPSSINMAHNHRLETQSTYLRTGLRSNGSNATALAIKDLSSRSDKWHLVHSDCLNDTHSRKCAGGGGDGECACRGWRLWTTWVG